MQAHHETGKESTKGGRCTWATIDMLPDLALLEIFDHYIDDDQIHDWHPLVHVCQRWRNVVFASPRRLNLRLLCAARTPVKEMLDIWPPLPIVVWSGDDFGTVEEWSVDYMIEVLEHKDRICELELFDVPTSQLDKILAKLQQPFPALRDLRFRHIKEMPTRPVVIPTSFLGGSAPCLQELEYDYFPFPELPSLLLSATRLVDLSLRRIPHSEYLSPETIVSCLSVMTRLEVLTITFEFHQRRLGQESRRPPPETCTLLPVLTSLTFTGLDEYLEDFVARIDAPLLDNLRITFFHHLTFHTPRLAQFIGRTPKIKAHGEARVFFSSWAISITLPSTNFKGFTLSISYRDSDSDEQFSLLTLAQVCRTSFPQTFIPAVEHLYILEDVSSLLCWYSGELEDDIENSQWLGLLHLFSGVKGLYLSSRVIPRIMPAMQGLQAVGERVEEVLPALQTLFLEEILPSEPVHSVQESIGRFVAARQTHPVTVYYWKWDFREVGLMIQVD